MTLRQTLLLHFAPDFPSATALLTVAPQTPSPDGYADIQEWRRWRQGQAYRDATTDDATNAYEYPNPANSHADYSSGGG